MNAMIKEWINALDRFNDADLADLEIGIKKTRLARREAEKNEAIQKFKEAYFELRNWVDIYYNINYCGIETGVVPLEDFDNFNFE